MQAPLTHVISHGRCRFTGLTLNRSNLADYQSRNIRRKYHFPEIEVSKINFQVWFCLLSKPVSSTSRFSFRRIRAPLQFEKFDFSSSFRIFRTTIQFPTLWAFCNTEPPWKWTRKSQLPGTQISLWGKAQLSQLTLFPGISSRQKQLIRRLTPKELS